MIEANGHPSRLPRDITVTADQLGALLTHVDPVVAVIDDAGKLVFVSPSVRIVLGYEPSMIVGRPVIDFMHPDEADSFLSHWDDAVDRDGSYARPAFRVAHANGSWVEMGIDVHVGPDVDPFGALVATLRPLTGVSPSELDLRDRLAREDQLVNLATTFVGLDIDGFDAGVDATLLQLGALRGVDRCSVLRLEDGAMVRTHQWCAPGVAGSVRDVLPLEWMSIFTGPKGFREVYFALPDGDVDHIPGAADMLAEGLRSTLGVPITHQGRLTGVISFGSRSVGPLQDSGHLALLRSAAGLLGEAFARNEAELLLAHRARSDLLTGLDNRWSFVEDVAGALDRLERGESPGFAVLLLDLDRFKVVNDSLGHLAGDGVLAAVAARLRGVAREGERLARLGGDEIVALLEGQADEPTAIARCRQLMEVFDEPFEVGAQEFRLSASGGLALARRGVAADDLLSRADAAMFLAKERGRRRLEVFDEALRLQVSERLQRENDLHRAVKNQELDLYYQPEVHLPTRTIRGVEALLRWHHPTRGLVVAGEFIHVAEETGIIIEIGDWVLTETCRQLAEWQAEGFRLTMRVNVSARQINHPLIVERVVEILAETGADPASLCLELTETAVMADAELSLDVLGKLAGLGVQLAIDDFGTGYSSLSYLKRFPVHVLKVDRSFVDGLGRSTDDAALVTAVLSLAEALGLTATAEGIESAEQLAELESLGCEFGQGYLFSRAVPPADIGRLMAAGTTLPESAGD